MKKQSPILKHAVESFEHGLEHYLDQTEKSRKFSLLQIDQAIELLLKEKVIQSGKSIYKSDGTTINLHEAFNSLKDIKIHERPRLEELHDLRNTIQHKGLTPDHESTRFYVDIAYNFFKRFLHEELEISVEEVINKSFRALIEVESLPEMSEAILLAQNAKNAPSSTDKIMTGYIALSKLVTCVNDNTLKSGFRKTLREVTSARGIDFNKVKSDINVIEKIHNRIVYSDYTPTDAEANVFIGSLEHIFKVVVGDKNSI